MKFIQITSARLENNQQTQANWILHALDTDGRIWELDDHHGWREVPLPIPADLPSIYPDAERCKHGTVIDPTGNYVCMKCFREPASPSGTAPAQVRGTAEAGHSSQETAEERCKECGYLTRDHVPHCPNPNR